MEKINWREKNIVSIDFDGVLSIYDGWKGGDVLGDPIKGAKEFILMIKHSGFTPVIFTTRKPKISDLLPALKVAPHQPTTPRNPPLRRARASCEFTRDHDDLPDFLYTCRLSQNH